MVQRICSLLAMFVMLLLLSAPTIANEKVALVVGNSAYEHTTRLPNPRNDADDIKSTLGKLGFEVIPGMDLSQADLRKAVKIFAEKLENAQVALFFYAGHAIQFEGSNYIISVDSDLAKMSDIDFETLAIEFITKQMERRAETSLVFLDACRNNPFATKLSRSAVAMAQGAGLAAPDRASSGTFFAYATEPGNVALDGDGRNSPFTLALLKNLRRPGVEISTMMTDVRREVHDLTDGKQVPFVSSSLLGQFYFDPNPQGDIAADERTRLQQLERQATAWEKVKESDDLEEVRGFIDAFRDGPLVAAAQMRLELLQLKSASRTIPQFESGEHAAEPINAAGPPTGVLIASVQGELNRLGCNAGEEDGVWGSKGRAAVLNFSSQEGLKLASIEPSEGLLQLLRSRVGRVCPLNCEPRYRPEGDKCVLRTCPSGQVLTDKGLCAVPGAFDGLWAVGRRSDNPKICTWKEIIDEVTVRNNVVSGRAGTDTYEGKIEKNGTFRIIQSFNYAGRRNRNILVGRIDIAKGGTGTFRHDGGQCRGKVLYEKL